MTLAVLAVDTSGDVVTAAVHDGVRTVAGRAVHDPRRHAELLAPTVAAVLADAGLSRGDLTHVVAGVGPGPFTGLRVGVVTARVLGAALAIPVLGVCSLDAIADDARLVGDFLVATDARRREVYWARYRRAASGEPAARVEGPHVTVPGAVSLLAPDGARLTVAGRGALAYPDLLGPAHDPADVDAGALAGLAARALTAPAGSAARAVLVEPVPLYLRRPDAAVPGERKRVLR